MVRANSALLRVGNEINKLVRGRPEFHRPSLVECLRNVEPAHVNQLERRFDFVALLCVESGTFQPDNVKAENGVALRGECKRRQILSKGGTALHHYQPSNV